MGDRGERDVKGEHSERRSRERNENAVEGERKDARRTQRESRLLIRCDSQDGDSYARADALQVNSQETLRTLYSCIAGAEAKHFVAEEENSGTNT